MQEFKDTFLLHLVEVVVIMDQGSIIQAIMLKVTITP
jgi:hypothetical protein